MTDTAKAFAHYLVDLIHAEGGTALYDGLIRGMRQQLGSGVDSTKLAQAVFLCTDGQANVGEEGVAVAVDAIIAAI